MIQKGVQFITSKLFRGGIFAVAGSFFLLLCFSPVKEAAGQEDVALPPGEEEFCPTAACMSRQAEADKIKEEITKTSAAISALFIEIKNGVDAVNSILDKANQLKVDLGFLGSAIDGLIKGPLWTALVAYGRAARANAGQMDQPLREQLNLLAEQFGRTFQDALSEYIRDALNKLQAEIENVDTTVETYNSKVSLFKLLVAQIETLKKNIEDLQTKLEELEKQYKNLEAALNTLANAPSDVFCPISPVPPVLARVY